MHRLEQRGVEEFNEHVDTVLKMLDYANLERIWFEAKQQVVREGRRKVEQRNSNSTSSEHPIPE